MSISNTIGVISGINECVNLFQWARSAISSLHFRFNGTHQQKLQDEVLHLQSGLQCLSDTLPAMYNLIDRAEWRSHKQCVAELLPKFKDAVYDADDLLDEFRWYEQKVAVEGNSSQSSFIDFFNSVIQGSFNKVKDIQKRLENLSNQLEKMGLREVTARFDKSVRPETSSFLSETKIFGRCQELEQVMKLLGVDGKRMRERNKRRISGGLPVFPIVGIGGVGKTTMAQHICNHEHVKPQFNNIIWICVSDDFDVKRLTKEAIQSCSGEEARTDNLDSLQHHLFNVVRDKILLIILDDVWDDALEENGQRWKRFCAPFTNMIEGSMLLVTTRSPKVAGRVCTMEPFALDGLKDDVFWNFFKLCMFGSQSCNPDPELERIGRSMLPKLKGSPLAAKTLGRLLRMNLHTTHWNNVLDSEFWELRQEETDILPALRLSYMHLPFHLKRCFSFCAVYPKDHEFEKGSLAEIWVAEGFVEPEGDIPIHDIACQYFEDLVNRSLFQKVGGAYVIHDLLHDMVQLVSKHECFILRNMSDFQKVPQNVRHLSILSNTNFECSKLLRLCKHTKILCIGECKLQSLSSEFSKLINLQRFELYGFRYHLEYKLKHDTQEVELNNERYLHGLKVHWSSLRSREHNVEQVLLQPPTSLRTLLLRGYPGVSLPSWYQPQNLASSTSLVSISVFPFLIHLIISDCQNLSSLEHFLHPASVPFVKKIIIEKCTSLVSVPSERFRDLHCLEELEVVHCPNICSQTLVAPSLQRLVLGNSGNFADNIKCCSLTKCFIYYSRLTCTPLQHLPALQSLNIASCESLTSVRPAVFTNLSHCRSGCTGSITSFLCLTVLIISSCNKLSTLDDLLTQECLPAIERIYVGSCGELLSLPGERFGNFLSLKDLEIYDCPSLDWRRGLVLPSSLQRLFLGGCGNISACVPSCLRNLSSLVSLELSVCPCITSIPGDIWSSNLASLDQLYISDCPELVSVGGSKAVENIKTVYIYGCPKMKELKSNQSTSR